MADEDEKLLGGKLIELQPEKVNFACPDCGLNCILWPRAMPMATQHALPACKAFKNLRSPQQLDRGENEQGELVLDFLKRAKLPILGGGTL